MCIKYILFNKSYLIVFFFIIFSLPLFSQGYSIQPYMGIGSTLSKGGEANQRSRGRIGLGFFYHIRDKFLIGIDLNTSGSIITLLGGSASEDIFNASTNTITLDPINMNGNTFLLKTRYLVNSSSKHFRPYFELGIGTNSYYKKIFNIPSLPTEKVQKINFAFQPEIGCTFWYFFASLSYLHGGRTPVFTGVNSNGNILKMYSIQISPIYFNMGIQFPFGKHMKK